MNPTTANLRSISVHFVGNKSQEQGHFLSKEPLVVDDEMAERLTNYFVGKFTTVHDVFRFHHPSSLQFNEVYNYVKEAFESGENIHALSLKIALHLYESSVHPKVNAGELYVCRFENCLVDNQAVDAIGIFKTEHKSGFFEVDKVYEGFKIQFKEGLDVNKMDKGCLIYNVKGEDGYQVSIVDQQNRGLEAQYWREDFLGLMQVSNDFHQTNQFLGITKNYLTKQLSEDFQVTKADQIDLLNRSVDYFKKRDEFDRNEFEAEVLRDLSVIESFRNFDSQFRQDHDIDLDDNFEISIPAVKKQARVFKSVLKLDKNFHIYIHGNRELIEQGEDHDGRKYYKIYYKEEY